MAKSSNKPDYLTEDPVDGVYRSGSLKVYVGYAIDQAREDPATTEDKIRELLSASERSFVAYFPRLPFVSRTVGGETPDWDFVRQINEAAIKEADVCIFVSNGSFSFGLPIEVDYATIRQKPWVFIDRSGKAPGAYITSLKRSESLITTSDDEALEWLKQVYL